MYNHSASALLGLTLALAQVGVAAAQSIPRRLPPPTDTQEYTAAATPYPSTSITTYPAVSGPEVPLGLGAPVLAEPTLAEPIPVGDVDETSSAQEMDLNVAVEDEPRWYYPSYWIQLPGWDTAVELGINGSSGTSESLSVRTGGYIKRESKARKFNFELYHNRTKAGGVETQNNAQSKIRHEWLMPDSPWTVYAQTQLYYDQFQAFDLSLNLNGGIGYRFVDEDWLELTGRFGAGSVREYGSPEDEWVPEAQFGLDYEQKLSETQKLTASVDYYPEWEDFGQYRMLSELAWEVELAVPSNVSLKVAANNRHDSDPHGADPNNFNYSVLLLWKL